MFHYCVLLSFYCLISNPINKENDGITTANNETGFYTQSIVLILRFPDWMQCKLLEAARMVDVAVTGLSKKRTFKKLSFRGVDLDALLVMSTDELVKLFNAGS
ncbi:hypothetical protein PHAVU_002G148550 [Phaseolus vulgaris]